MDVNHWKNIFSQTAQKVKNSTISLTKNVAGFVGKHLSNTPLFLQNQEDFDLVVQNNKRVAIIAISDESLRKEIMTMFPVWQTRAFIDSAELRFVLHTESPDFYANQNFASPVEMRLYFEGNKTHSFVSWDDIRDWWTQSERKYQSDLLDPLSQNNF